MAIDSNFFSDFKKWLEVRGVESEKTRRTLDSTRRVIEQKLDTLDFPYRNLGEAWEADRFKALYELLENMLKDVRSGGQDYRLIWGLYTKVPSAHDQASLSSTTLTCRKA